MVTKPVFSPSLPETPGEKDASPYLHNPKETTVSSFPQGTCWRAQESLPFLTSLRCTVREGASYLTVLYLKHTHTLVFVP